jgi:DNA-binding NtrC family response regulator
MTSTIARGGFVRSAAMLAAVHDLQLALTSTGGVLLCGEPGTGRAQFARVIHLAGDGCQDSIEKLLRMSMQNVHPNGRPFVEFDCALPNGVEFALFGCDAAASSKDGVERVTDGSALYRALGGTLLLQQVPELPARLQLRLARVLRDGEVSVQRPDGTERLEAACLRPIATMEPAAGDDRLVGELRKRLSQFTIRMPPLRKRREDIPSLARHMLVDICQSLNLPVKKASRQASQLLSALPWQGNLQEMRALLRVLALKVPGPVIRQGDILRHVRLDGRQSTLAYVGPLKEARDRFEREYVSAVLEQHQGKMADAAKALGLQRTNLYRKVRQLSVKRLGRQ